MVDLIWNKIANPLKSGISTLINHSSRHFSEFDEQYAIISGPRSVLEFDPGKGGAICIGINKQFHPEYAAKSLGETAARDAQSIGESLATNLGLDRDKIKIFTSSEQPNHCKKSGLRDLFIGMAKGIEKDGIFMFYFAGHGYMVNGRCVIAPADFAGKEDLSSGISGDDLVEWLHVAECKAKHVLIVLDCCYAGDLGTSLTFPGNKIIEPSLFVMCGCAAREKCLSVGALGHSIFTYFLLQYMAQNCRTGKFEVKKVMEDVTKLCYSFSSLLVSYNHATGKLSYGGMNPTLDTLDIPEVDASIDVTDSGRFELLIQLFMRGQPKPTSHPEVDKWLKSNVTQKSLQTLSSMAKPYYNSDTLQEGIFCTMMYSAASIQYGHDKSNLENNRNLFVVLAIEVLGAIGFAYPEVNVSPLHIMKGLDYYKEPLRLGKMSTDFIKEMMLEIANTPDKSPSTPTAAAGSYTTAKDDGDEVDGPIDQVDGPVDQVDGSVVQQPVLIKKKLPQLSKLPFWEPL